MLNSMRSYTDGAAEEVCSFFPVPVLLSQLVAKMNVLVWEMTHPQPEVLRRERANFSFTFLSIASISVFIATKTLAAL